MVFHSSSEFEFTLKKWFQKAVSQFKTGLTDVFFVFFKIRSYISFGQRHNKISLSFISFE